MSGYAKLFSSIVESSLWDEDSDTCKVWITLLALADSEGFIRGSRGWLAKRARVDVDCVDKALTKFESPDPFSRTATSEGRRLESTPDGWVIINYALHRRYGGTELSKDPRRVYQREWIRKKRAEIRASQQCQQVSTGVDACRPPASASASVQGNGEYEGKGKRITDARIIIHYLNEQAGRSYRETNANFKLICARLDEVKGDVDGVKRMIVRQCGRWKGDPKMDEYLRVSTLFGKSHFEEYYDNRDLPIEPAGKKQRQDDLPYYPGCAPGETPNAPKQPGPTSTS